MQRSQKISEGISKGVLLKIIPETFLGRTPKETSAEILDRASWGISDKASRILVCRNFEKKIITEGTVERILKKLQENPQKEILVVYQKKYLEDSQKRYVEAFQKGFLKKSSFSQSLAKLRV